MSNEAGMSTTKTAKVVHSPPSTLRSGKIREISESQPNLNAESRARTERDERVEILERKIELIMAAISEPKISKSRDNSPKSITSEEEKNSAKSERVTGYASDETNTREANMQAINIGGMRFPRGGWIKSPFDELKFVGRNNKMNPIRFLKKFNEIAEYERVDETEQLYFFAKCLRDEAAVWFELKDYTCVYDAKNEFARHFWGENQQAKFREKIYLDKYNANNNTRMANYALNLARQAKLLDPPMGDAEIIRCVKRHFNKETAREIKTTTIKTIAELTDILKEIQDDRETVNKIRENGKANTRLFGNTKKTTGSKNWNTRKNPGNKKNITTASRINEINNQDLNKRNREKKEGKAINAIHKINDNNIKKKSKSANRRQRKRRRVNEIRRNINPSSESEENLQETDDENEQEYSTNESATESGIDKSCSPSENSDTETNDKSEDETSGYDESSPNETTSEESEDETSLRRKQTKRRKLQAKKIPRKKPNPTLT